MGVEEFRQLIPILHPRTRLQDLDALRAWYEAMADVFRLVIPADLLALWLYDEDGVPILVEPEALAEDNLLIPYAKPLVDGPELAQVEDRIRRAGYGSVQLRPIRHGGQDVALILLAAFSPYAHGETTGRLMAVATDAMAPMLARVVSSGRHELHAPVAPRPSLPTVLPAAPAAEAPAHPAEHHASPVREEDPGLAVLGSIADAIGGAGTPRDLMLALSFALQAVLPHDCYELLIPDGDGEHHYRLGLHGHGALWGDPALTWNRATLDPGSLFAGGGSLLIHDAQRAGLPPLPELVTVRGAEVPPRALIGVPLRVVERLAGYILLGSAGPGLYREEDLVLLDRIGAVLAPRVEGMVLAWQYGVLRGQFDLLRHVPGHLAKVAELLATTPFLGEGSRLFVQQVQAMLPAAALEFCVRTSGEHRVAVVRPGVSTPLADLPHEPIEGSGVAQVMRGELPYLLASQLESGSQVGVLVVPLRTGGEVFGAMAVTSEGLRPFSRSDMALAQQLADLAAPHLDLARRSSGLALPPMPGWKRPTFRTERERGD